MMPAGMVHYNGGSRRLHQGSQAMGRNSRSIRGIALLAAIAIAAIGAVPALGQSYESYGVFCANGRIAVDSRPEEQMSSGRSACQLRRFPSRSAAENFARSNFGGVGASCSCR
jgi:hypothetical protein